MRKLENLNWSPKWVSHLGCVKGCLDYLGVEISDAWLYGGTGHAFVINLHDEVCPSGPTAWHTGPMAELGPNLGYTLDCVFGTRGGESHSLIQCRAFEHVQRAIDEGLPCYGWELEIPEFYVVYGYDEGGDGVAAGYYYRGPGCEEGKGPKPWQELGATGIGVVEMYSVAPGEPADPATTVREALAFALRHASNPEGSVFQHYRAGIEGWDNWIRAVRQGRAGEFGMRFNAAVWLECRRFAAAFLREARERLAGRAAAPLEEAIAHYDEVAIRLGEVASAYPFRFDAPEDPLPVDDASMAAAEALAAAREAEAAGLGALERIVEELS